MMEGSDLVKERTSLADGAFDMLKKIFWRLRLEARRLWVRAAIISALALIAAALAPLSNLLPFPVVDAIDPDALSRLLDILTGSMLAVTTFSLSVMVTAHLSADKNVTPRSHRLLTEDSRTHTVLATFIGAFIYALALTVMLNAGVLKETELAAVYFMTAGVIAFVAIALLRWVAHLAGLGSFEATTRRVEERVTRTLSDRAPFLGGAPLDGNGTIPADAAEVHAAQYGFLQNIDTAALSEWATETGGLVWVASLPGSWIDRGEVILRARAETFTEEDETRLRGAVAIGDVRVWDQDPAFPMIVAAEIAERALSPGINDPRTAIDVIGRLGRLIGGLERETAPDEIAAPGVFVPAMATARLVRETLDPIARDGAGFVEVQMAVQRALGHLALHRDPAIAEAARETSRRALAYAADGLLLRDDIDRVTAAAIARGPAATAGEDAEQPGQEGIEPGGTARA
ncbi:DUF2254 domain-containing protein [Palleronia sediminis]|uniref:DUF2254 domain-containing protein n=2 Tax=Palleronia sediminis TaxID=2547833 RepID=A0A4R5ZY62_9RHOB|nr:DUF2254 domain-containing protein [Palleronia sediminis]